MYPNCKSGSPDGKLIYVPDLKTAILIAKDGDVIFVSAGRHEYVAKSEKEERKFVVKKSLRIVGEGAHLTCIRGKREANAFFSFRKQQCLSPSQALG